MESNYETLRLNENIAVAGYHGGCFYPAICNSHAQNRKGEAPVIDYFDYVNPSDIDKTEEDKNEEKKEEAMESTGSWAEEVEREFNDLNTEKDITNDNRTVNECGKNCSETASSEKSKKSNRKQSETSVNSDLNLPVQNDVLNSQRDSQSSNGFESVLRKKKKSKLDKSSSLVKETHSSSTISKADSVQTAEGNLHAAIKPNTSKGTAADATEKLKETKNQDIDKSKLGKEKSVEPKEFKQKSNKTKDKTKADSVKRKDSNGKDSVEMSNEDKEVSETVQTSISSNLNNKAEYRTALQVDTSYTAGVSSDSNCSQYSVGSWTSEQDTSSSLDPSPNPWGSYIDSGVSFGTSTGIYSDTSDVSGEDGSVYDSNQRQPPDFHSAFDGKSVQIYTRFPYSTKLCYNTDDSEFNGAIQNENGAFHTVTYYNDGYEFPIANFDNYKDYVNHVTNVDSTCDYCSCCSCSVYESCPRERLFPGDMFYYSSNSMVLCVSRTKLPGSDAMKSQVSKV